MSGLIGMWVVGMLGLMAVAKVFGRRWNGLELVSLGFLVGGGLVGALLMGWWLVLGPWQYEVMKIIFGVMVLGAAWWVKEELKMYGEEVVKVLKSWRIYTPLLLALVISVGVVGFLARGQLSLPYIHADALTHWFTRAKLFYVDRGVRVETLSHARFGSTEEVLGEASNVGSLARYPIALPLMMVWNYMWAGEVGEIEGKWVFVGLELSVLFILAYTGYQLGGKKSWWPVVLVLALVAVPIHWVYWQIHWFGGADWWMAGLWLALLYCLYRYGTSKAEMYGWVAAFFVGMAAVMKVEGAVGFLGLLALWGLAGMKVSWVKKAGWLAVAIFPYVVWWWFGQKLTVGQDYLGQVFSGIREGLFSWERVGTTLTSLLEAFFNWQSFLGVWIVGFASLGYAIYRKRVWVWWLWLVPLGFLGFLVVSYVFNPLEVQSLIFSSMLRVMGQWVPALIFLSFVGIMDFEKKA